MTLIVLALVGLPGAAAEHSLPLFVSSSDSTQQGFVRITNWSTEAGAVEFYAIDDAGDRRGPVSLLLAAGATAHFNSDDLESGNDEKGLSGGVGVGQGHWRLDLVTDLAVEYSAYVRTADGFLTTTHEVVSRGRGGFHVPMFNPASNSNQRSQLRIVNPGEKDVNVRIDGLDDRGTPSTEQIAFSLAAGTATTISAEELENGGATYAGSFGDGTGKWQLFVTAGNRIVVMSLLENPTGHLTNLSRKAPDGALNMVLAN